VSSFAERYQTEREASFPTRRTSETLESPRRADRALPWESRVGNRGVQRLLRTEGAVAVSKPASQRKCSSCENSQRSCPNCDMEQSTRNRKLLTIKSVANIARPIVSGIGIAEDDSPVPMDDKTKPKKPPVKAPEKPKHKEKANCPTQTVTISDAQCGSSYGAKAKYCYSGIKGKDWWLKERVKNGPGGACAPGRIDETSEPGQSSLDDCVEDEILNDNGPPSSIAPCTETTLQTVFIGPTEGEVEQCKYANKQVIKITAANDKKSGKVITSSQGKEISCDW
jgi:hypothetical protein